MYIDIDICAVYTGDPVADKIFYSTLCISKQQLQIESALLPSHPTALKIFVDIISIQDTDTVTDRLTNATH